MGKKPFRCDVFLKHKRLPAKDSCLQRKVGEVAQKESASPLAVPIVHEHDGSLRACWIFRRTDAASSPHLLDLLASFVRSCQDQADMIYEIAVGEVVKLLFREALPMMKKPIGISLGRKAAQASGERSAIRGAHGPGHGRGAVAKRDPARIHGNGDALHASNQSCAGCFRQGEWRFL